MSNRPNFSKSGFILATVGSAIGLGNIWKFPYITYENDGGTFVLVYLAAVILIGAPLMMAEIFIGRHSKRNVVDSFKVVGKHPGMAGIWKGVGWLSLIALFFLIYYYSVAGWVIFYLKETIGWSVAGFNKTPAELTENFNAFLHNGNSQLFYSGIFLFFTALILSFGLTKGVEKMSKILMPALFTCLIIFVIAVSSQPGFTKAFEFLFHFDKITSKGVLEAIGHSFFTLSLGAGMGITFGSYLSKSQSIVKSTAMVVFFDTLVGLMACIIMYSIIFSIPEANRAESFGHSAVMLFTSLPKLLYNLPGGTFVAPLFYLAVGFAALTSTLAMGEVFITLFQEKLGWTRRKCAAAYVALSLIIVVPAGLSHGGVDSLAELNLVGDAHKGFFNILDYLVSNWMLVLAGLFTSLFIGWAFPAKPLREEMEEGHGTWKLFHIWRFSLRFILPAGIVWILVSVIQSL